MTFENMCKAYEDIVYNEKTCDHWKMVSTIVHWILERGDHFAVLSAGEFLVDDSGWGFMLPKFKDVECNDGMIHLNTHFLLKGAKDYDEVEIKDLILDPESLTDMKIFLAMISNEIRIRNDWSLVYERVAS